MRKLTARSLLWFEQMFMAMEDGSLYNEKNDDNSKEFAVQGPEINDWLLFGEKIESWKVFEQAMLTMQKDPLIRMAVELEAQNGSC